MTELQIDGYEIIRKLGQGGMAQVYLAREVSLDREVAIKILPAYLVEREDLRRRFRREARTIAKLAHRSIVPVYDYGEGSKGPYLSMRYMQGGSLADKLKNGPLSFIDAVKIIDRLADGLDKAHEKGVIHRDLKPGNILFDEDGIAYLADFGIVKLTNPDTSITPTDGLVGTPAYMSPEQVEGDVEIDGRSDIYALGVILFEILTGALPYHASTPYKVAMKHVMAPLPLILEVNPSLPIACDRIIRKAMAKKPDDRYQTARGLANELLKNINREYVNNRSPQNTLLRADRTLDVALPKQIIVGKATELIAMIRRSNSEGLKAIVEIDQILSTNEGDVTSKTFTMEFPVSERGDPESGKLILRVESPDFEPKRQEKRLTIPPDGDSEIVTFILVPQIPGELILSVELYKDQDFITSRILKTNGVVADVKIGHNNPSIVSIPLSITSNWSMTDFRALLFKMLCDHFNESELYTLCFMINVPYEEFGPAKSDIARETILYLERRGRISELLTQIIKARPFLKPIIEKELNAAETVTFARMDKPDYYELLRKPTRLAELSQKFQKLKDKKIWLGLVAVAIIVFAYGVFATFKSLQSERATPTTAVSEIVASPQPKDEATPIVATALPFTSAPVIPTDTLTPLMPSLTVMAVTPATINPFTATPVASKTITPEELTVNVVVQMRTITTNVKVYAGPSDSNPALGLLDYGVVVEVIGKVRGSSWYLVRTGSNLTGWINADTIEFIAGNDSDVVITWPPTPETETSFTPSLLCVNEQVIFDPNGDVRILWNEYPISTHYLKLTVSSLAEEKPLIYPSNIDQNDTNWAKNGYTIGSWLFEQRGFPRNTTYRYVLQAMDGTGVEICSVSGSFVN